LYCSLDETSEPDPDVSSIHAQNGDHCSSKKDEDEDDEDDNGIVFTVPSRLNTIDGKMHYIFNTAIQSCS